MIRVSLTFTDDQGRVQTFPLGRIEHLTNDHIDRDGIIAFGYGVNWEMLVRAVTPGDDLEPGPAPSTSGANGEPARDGAGGAGGHR